jgi:acyl carrier protein
MLDRAALTAPIQELVIRALPVPAASGKIDPDADLHAVGLTSMAMVRLMLAVEAAFDVSIPDAELSPENFRSIRALESLVERLRMK